MLGNLYMMKMSKDEERYNKYRDSLVSQFHRVEKRLGDGPWFNGEKFSLADTAFAPLFQQNSVAGNKLSVLNPESMPKVNAWAQRLLALPEVRDSVVGEFEDLYLDSMQKNESYSLSRLAA
jgi:glutathione S-transferase